MTTDSAARIASVGDYTELAFLALAHLAPEPSTTGSTLHAAASLFDRRLLQWVHDHLPAAAWEPLATDAEVMSRLVHGLPARDVLALQWLPILHRDVAELRATARSELGKLSPAAVSDGPALDALRSAAPAPVELLRCAMLLCAPAWSDAHASTIAPEMARACDAVQPWLDRAIELAPALGRHPIQLVHALGPRGRALGEAIFVGAPCAWNRLPPEHAALQALHEAAVHAAAMLPLRATGPLDRWALAEAAAIAAVGRLAAGSELAGAREAWRARFDLRALASPEPPVVAALVRSLQGLVADRQG